MSSSVTALVLLFPKRGFSYQRRAGLVVVVVGITYIIAYFVTEVDLVLGIAGSLGEQVPSWSLRFGSAARAATMPAGFSLLACS